MMRKTRFLLWFATTAIIVVLVWVKIRPRDSQSALSPMAARENATPPNTTPASRRSGAPAAATETAARPPAPADADEAERQLRIARYEAEAEADIARADVPIRFWGKVLDQASEPIPGVEVSFEVCAYVRGGQGALNYESGKVSSNRDGLFGIEGVHGNGIRITQLTKSGHVPVGFDDRRNYSYAQLSIQNADIFHPDPAAPVIYKMWRLEGPQTLHAIQFYYEVPSDGTVRRTDTSNGLLEGAFRLRFQRGEIANANKTVYDWTFTLELERGGIQHSIDEFMFLAPADGYIQRLEITMKATNPNWRQKATVGFFARTASGKYGRFVIDVSGPYFGDGPRARVRIDGALNPAGSRNLEPNSPAGGPSPGR